MQVAVEKTGSYLRKVSITIPAGDVESAFTGVFSKITKSAALPGFRPGKVPRSLVEKRFASEASVEVQNRLVEESLYKAMDANEVQAVGVPKLTMGELVRGDEFSYSAEVEVRPEVNLVKYKGLGAPKVDAEVKDEALQAELDQLAERAVQLVPVMIRDVAQHGDVVQVDYEGSIGGVPFEGGSAENAMVEIGGENYIPGFAEGLEGAKVPSEREVAVTFPEDYSSKELAGKEAIFKFKLKELKTKELPAVDDDFAKDQGYESLEALKEAHRKRMADSKKAEAREAQRKALLADLVKENPVEIPPSMIESQTERMVQNTVQKLQQMLGQRLGLTRDDIARMRENSMPNARQEVAGALLLMEVAKAENLEVSSDEIQAEVDRLVEEAGEHAERARVYFESEDQRENINFRLLEDKVFEFLMAHSVEVEPQADAENPEAGAGEAAEAAETEAAAANEG